MNFLFKTSYSVWLSLLLFAFLTTSESAGQVVVQPGRVIRMSRVTAGAPVVTSSPAAMIADESAEAVAEANEAEGKKPEKSFADRRVEAIIAAPIDRSLPSVLKAWSEREKAEKEKVAVKKPKAIGAKVANIFEDLVVLNFEKKPAFAKDQLIEIHFDENRVGVVKILSVEDTKVTGNFQSSGKPTDNTNGKAAAAMSAQAAAAEKASTAKPAAEDSPATGEDSSEDKPDENDAEESEGESDAGEGDEPSKEKTTKAADRAWSVLKTGSEVTVKKPDNGSAKKAEEEAQIKSEVAQWSKMVTLGKWDQLKSFLVTFKEDDADKIYGHLLAKLAAVPGAKKGGSRNNQRETPPSNFLSPEDILQITDAAPKPWLISVTGNKKFKGLGKQVAGKWEGTVTPEGADIPAGVTIPDIKATLNIELDGGSVSGTMSIALMDDAQSLEFSDGEFDSESGLLTFSATVDSVTMSAELTVKDGSMTGVLSTVDGGPALRFEGELVEPAEQPAEESDSDEVAATEDALPEGVVLPPGVSLDELPPEVQEQLKAQGAKATAGSAKKSNKSKSHIPALAKLVSKSNKDGFDLTSYIETIRKGASGIGGEDSKQKLIAADLFLKSGLLDEVESFLPPLKEAVEAEQIIPIKMWSQLALTKYRSKQIAKWLNSAWEANIALTNIDSIATKDAETAMANLIQLSPKIDRKIGEKWLDESFTQSPQRGMTILTNLGTKSSTMARQAATVGQDERIKLLRLQNGAVEKLLKISPQLADQWADALTLLADTWIKEADIAIKFGSSNSGGGYWDYDQYGNSYWVSDQQYNRRYRGNNRPQPIRVGDVLEIAPSEQWRKRIRSTLTTQLQRTLASLHLRVNEEDKAFPWIEKLSEKNPKVAKTLVEEFLKIWTQNHNPNSDRQRRNPYIYFYGFDQKADAIPLTRSKQQRNLVELQGWVDRIRAMDLEKLDEKLLANAFTTCHSTAEVYDLERVKSVFGDLGNLKPETIAELAQKMRLNLASNWRDIRQQEAKQTKRREPEVQQEVLRGYVVGLNLIDEALKTSPDNWRLHLTKACLMFDQNAYSQSVKKSSEFSNRRDLAFDQFQIAADKYRNIAATLEEKDHSTEVYDYWFYCGLGACDLGKVTDKTLPDLRQYAKIRSAIESLPGLLAESHMAKVANNLFTRMNPLKPEIKFRYLRGGFEIVGNHPRAWEAKNLHDYYKDLVSEIKLDVRIDGDDNVGHEGPFGIYVNLLHTKEIERESGGFSKYAQNQNSMRYSYNYGRPTEDYRDKFNDAVNQALEEHFEIQSVTFQNAETMKSHPTERDGWRVTPYAYILLKPRGSEVDRIAPLKLDLDFLDTSGYVVIPVESPAVVIDASQKKGSPRPVSDLQITQTLDERQAEEGKLILEVTAKAKGLVPDLESIFDLERDNFEVVSIDDQGVLPSSFDQDSNDIQILSDRSWTVEYKAKPDRPLLTTFEFGESKSSDVAVKYQRYEGADLVDSEQSVSLERNYASFSWSFLYWLIPLVAALLVGIAGLIYLTRKPAVAQQKRFDVPETINPFTVLSLLEDIRRNNGISQEQAKDLETSINRVQKYYFAKEANVSADQAEDLTSLANRWVSQAR